MTEKKQKIKALVCGNCSLLQELLCIALESEGNIEVSENANGVDKAVGMVRQQEPNVLILVLIIPFDRSQALETLPNIQKACPDTKILLLGCEFREEDIFKWLEVGVRGCISSMKTCAKDIVRAVNALQNGEFWIERKTAGHLLAKGFAPNCQAETGKQESEPLLSKRETEVLAWVSQGLTNKEIASKLFISEKTVKSHMNRIFKKLSIKRRAEAIVYAVGQGLLNLNQKFNNRPKS